jgi:hypothetical protein
MVVALVEPVVLSALEVALEVAQVEPVVLFALVVALVAALVVALVAALVAAPVEPVVVFALVAALAELVAMFALVAALAEPVVMFALVAAPVEPVVLSALVVALVEPVVMFVPPVPNALVAAPLLPEPTPRLAQELPALVFAPPCLVPPQLSALMLVLPQIGLLLLSALPRLQLPVALNWTSEHQGSYSSLLGCSYNPMCTSI